MQRNWEKAGKRVGRRSHERLGRRGRIILIWIVGKYIVNVGGGWNWLR
jgi:hypothetical protein